METTPTPTIPTMGKMMIVDRRRDFIETYKKELIAIAVLAGLLLIMIIYFMFKKPSVPIVPQVKKQQQVVPLPIVPQVKKQQQVVPPIIPQVKKQQKKQLFPPIMKTKQLNSNLPNINSPLNKFSNQFIPTL